MTTDSRITIDRAIMEGLPLPASLIHVGGSLDLRRYPHPLPASLIRVGGDLDMRGYSDRAPSANWASSR